MKKKITNLIILALCVIITLATVVNVFGDNEAVEKMATGVACPDTQTCKLAKSALERTPLGQTFTFVGGGKSVSVVCRRSIIIFGEYSCEIRN